MSEWSRCIQAGEADAEARVRKDVKDAVRSMGRLGTVQKLDRLLYLVAVPTVFIPIVSKLVTFSATATRWYMERIQQKHGWILIGT